MPAKHLMKCLFNLARGCSIGKCYYQQANEINKNTSCFLHCFSDTDSVIYVSHNDTLSSAPQGWYEPPTGQTLGLLSNELKQGEFIWRFQALAPKNYRYEIRLETDPLGETTRTEMKCKGQLLTTNVKSSFDWEIYQALIDRKIKPLANVYEKLKLGPHQSAELTANAFEKFKLGDVGPALVLPSPTLEHCKLSARIHEDLKKTRLMRLNFNKRK